MRLFRKPTPDEELVNKIKDAVADVASLGAEAASRGIKVWLKDTSWGIVKILEARDLQFNEAVRSTRTRIG